MVQRKIGCYAALTSLSLLALSACASANLETDTVAEAEPDPRRGEEVNKICFNRTIDNFKRATKSSVVLSTSPNKEYLVEIRGSCIQLRRAQRIAIDSTLSCVTRNDLLIVSDSLFSSSSNIRPDRCFISKIYQWDKNAEAAPETTDEG